ncbi:DedA family protein [Terrabacter carboxydivorans]|uniref:VTT domain-containing protein n=1 Tax=Terrabacter carboxydivorans TaxID=619730 RepID=A0ABP5YTJ2_9MICO
MLDALAALPFWQALLALFASAMVRSNGTYWVGRGAIAGWRRHRGEHGELTARAERLVSRFGPFAVTLSYLTVGIQTAIHLTAGVVRMPLRWYVPAAVVGSVVWAVLYATVGLAVVQAWVAAEAGSWWGLLVVALVVAGLVGWLVARRHSAAADAGTGTRSGAESSERPAPVESPAS